MDKPATAQIEPCPFCSSIADLRKEYDQDDTQWHYIICRSCGARSRGKWVSSPNNACPIHYQEVRDEWNNRAACNSHHELVDALESAYSFIADQFGNPANDAECDDHFGEAQPTINSIVTALSKARGESQ